jgi:hypothetical protein
MKKKVYVSHQNFKFNWSGEWIYIGRNYSKILDLEKRLDSRKRISITKKFREEFENERQNYLDWSESQRIENNDSLVWWVSHLAGRNIMCSFIFESICQIKALKSILFSNNDQILVVAENAFLASTISHNLSNTFNLKKTKSYYLGHVYDFVGSLIIIPIRFSLQIYKLWILHLNARFSYKKVKTDISEDVFLINLCLDTVSFKDPYKLKDRYLTILPDWLETKGYKVIRIPWLYNVNLPLKKVYKKLRQDDCLIIQDYLSFFDYITAIYKHVQSVFAPKYSIQYPDLYIKSLLINEQLIQARTTGNIQFWLNGFAIKKWVKSYRNVSYVHTFELMPPEHAPIYYLKNSNLNYVKTIGYYHSIVSRDFLGYWSKESEQQSIIFPDLIITNGSAAKKNLICQGYDMNKIIIGPTLRQSFRMLNSFNDKSGILLLCPYDVNTACEAIIKLDKALLNLKQHSFSVQVKSHPMMKKNDILHKLPNESLPKNWAWNDSEINTALENMYCCIVLASASVFDAILSNCIVINLQRELSAMGNFSDYLQDKYPSLKEVPEYLLPERINDIFFAKKELYHNEFIKIKEELINHLNPINDKTMSVFLTQKPNVTSNVKEF